MCIIAYQEPASFHRWPHLHQVYMVWQSTAMPVFK